MKPLTDRDFETLRDVLAATDNFIRCDNYKDGWVMPLDCGGSNGSHHSYTLRKLSLRGLCDRKKYGGKREKGSCRYRINNAGREAIAARCKG
jgi:hypothetical protein